MPVLRRQAAYAAAIDAGVADALTRLEAVLGDLDAIAALAGDKTISGEVTAAVRSAVATAATTALDTVEVGAERAGFLCDLCGNVRPQVGKCSACLGAARRLVVAWEPVD